MAPTSCLFCEIIRGARPSARVLESDTCIAFLDVKPLFGAAQRVARALEPALGADGTFVALNNRVSQSVPHLHVHVVPRKKGDGLRGFFWPRVTYADDAEREAFAAKIRAAL